MLFLTARSAINDVVEGFELGANDYLKKPFGMQELIVRIKSLTAHSRQCHTDNHVVQPQSEWIEIGMYSFNPVTQQLRFAGLTEDLSHRESEILRRLSDNCNKIVNTNDILMDLWGDDSFFNSRSLHVFITKLRHKLAKDTNIKIVNVRGIGYKLIVYNLNVDSIN